MFPGILAQYSRGRGTYGSSLGHRHYPAYPIPPPSYVYACSKHTPTDSRHLGFFFSSSAHGSPTIHREDETLVLSTSLVSLENAIILYDIADDITENPESAYPMSIKSMPSSFKSNPFSISLPVPNPQLCVLLPMGGGELKTAMEWQSVAIDIMKTEA